MAVCVYKYFLKIVEDKEIKPILEYALQLAESHISQISEFLKNANYQVPIGFTESDVNLNAPRLFSDHFLLFYSYIMTVHGVTAYSVAITVADRKDIQDYFFECTATSKELLQKIVELSKTLPNFSSVPTIPSFPFLPFNFYSLFFCRHYDSRNRISCITRKIFHKLTNIFDHFRGSK